jgi:hypothetical protein
MLALSLRKVGTEDDGLVEGGEPGEGGRFDDGFSKDHKSMPPYYSWDLVLCRFLNRLCPEDH